MSYLAEYYVVISMTIIVHNGVKATILLITKEWSNTMEFLRKTQNDKKVCHISILRNKKRKIQEVT